MGGVMSFIGRWYSEGVECMPPPCLYVRPMRRVLNDNECVGGISTCKNMGRFGLDWAERNRAPLMFFAFWLSFFSTILMFVVFASVSYKNQTVMNANWLYGYIGDDVRFYLGLNRVVTTCTGDTCPFDTKGYDFSDIDCQIDACKDCKDTSSGIVAGAVLSFLTMVPQMSTNLQRSQARGDLNCQKVFGVLTSLLGAITSLITLDSFTTGCYDKFPNTYNGTDISYYYGPSFFCLLFATIFKFFDCFFNAILPVPAKGGWGEDEMDEDLNKHEDSSTSADNAL